MCFNTWIYLIRDNDTGFHKIGKAGDPEQRLKQLIRQDTLQPKPNDYELIEAWDTCSEMERELHVWLQECRVRGEWFDLDKSWLDALHDRLSHCDRWNQEYSLAVQNLHDEIDDLEKALKALGGSHPWFPPIGWNAGDEVPY